MPKRLILTALLTFLSVSYLKTASAADCWTRGENDEIRATAGAKLMPGGYFCADQRAIYAEVLSADGEPRELVLVNRGVPGSDWIGARVKPRPPRRLDDLEAAGMAPHRGPEVANRSASL